MKGYTQPGVGLESFTCPTCHVHAHQRWSALAVQMPGLNTGAVIHAENYEVGRCDACGAFSIWFYSRLAFPSAGAVSEPNSDMPQQVKTDFEEAIKIFADSPRASCALLRLALQKLCLELGLPGENLNADIGSLVTMGLPESVRKSLDIVRFIGNEQVHPGVIVVRDDPHIAVTLFALLNLITEYMISNPKRIEELQSLMPDSVKAQIQKRDSQAQSKSAVRN